MFRGTAPVTSETIDANVRHTKFQSTRPSNKSESRFLHRKHANVVTSGPTVAPIYDVTSLTPENDVRRTDITYRSSRGHGECIRASDETTGTRDAIHTTVVDKVRYVDVRATPTEYSSVITESPFDSVASGTKVRVAAHSSSLERDKFVRVSKVTSSTVASNVGSTTRPRCLERTQPRGSDENCGRDSYSRPAADVRLTSLPPRQSHLQHTTSLESRTVAQRVRRPTIQRINPDSLAGVGGLTKYAATVRPWHPQTTLKRVSGDHRGTAGSTCTASKSYVSIWRKRVATYEAFVNRCQKPATGSRHQQGHQHRN